MRRPSSFSRRSNCSSAWPDWSPRATNARVGALRRHPYHGVLAPNARLRPQVIAIVSSESDDLAERLVLRSTGDPDGAALPGTAAPTVRWMIAQID